MSHWTLIRADYAVARPERGSGDRDRPLPAPRLKRHRLDDDVRGAGARELRRLHPGAVHPAKTGAFQRISDGIAGAQALGIAEADPSYDLEGWDSAVKLAALSAAVWGQPLSLSAVTRDPVDASTGPRAAAAMKAGRRLVLVAAMHRDTNGSVAAEVRLRDYGPQHPFHALSTTSLALRITSRLLCPITICSEQPAPRDTAYGLLADTLECD